MASRKVSEWSLIVEPFGNWAPNSLISPIPHAFQSLHPSQMTIGNVLVSLQNTSLCILFNCEGIYVKGNLDRKDSDGKGFRYTNICVGNDHFEKIHTERLLLRVPSDNRILHISPNTFPFWSTQ